MILSKSELEELTGKKRPKAQKAVLLELCIPFKTRPDGTLVVFTHDLGVTTQSNPEPALHL